MDFFSSLLSQISEPASTKMSTFAGLLFVGAAGACLIDGIIRQRRSSYLNSAIELGDLKALHERLQNSTIPLAVRVSGKVQSDEPISCGLANPDSMLPLDSNPALGVVQLQEDAFSSVIYEAKTEIIYEDSDCKGDQFTSIMEVASVHREVTWHLADATEKVRVVGIQKAIGFDLIAFKREVAGPGTRLIEELPFYRELDDRREIKVLGVKHTQRALRLDSPLTIVGNAVREDNGNIKIHKPLFVCETKSHGPESIMFDSSCAWQIVSMSAIVTSLIIFVVEGLKNVAK